MEDWKRSGIFSFPRKVSDETRDKSNRVHFSKTTERGCTFAGWVLEQGLDHLTVDEVVVHGQDVGFVSIVRHWERLRRRRRSFKGKHKKQGRRWKIEKEWGEVLKEWGLRGTINARDPMKVFLWPRMAINDEWGRRRGREQHTRTLLTGFVWGYCH